MADDQRVSCLRYGVQNVLFLALSTIALAFYLFMVTLMVGWGQHLGYVAVMLVFFAVLLWLRAKLHHTGLSRGPDPDTPPPV